MLGTKYILLIWFGFLTVSCLSRGQICSISTDSEGVTTDDCPKQFHCVENVCVHKDIFPLNAREIIGSIFIMLVAGLANAGGIGGGSVLSPILLIIFGYDTDKTIMLVYVLIFGGSLGTYLNVAFQRDIQTAKPIVLYDFVIIVAPMMLIGSNIGVLLNRIIPPIVTLLGLIYLMVRTLRTMYQKAKVSYSNETKELQEPLIKNTNESSAPNKQPIELALMNKADQRSSEIQELPPNVKGIIEEDDSLFPARKIIMLACLIAFLILVTVLRGTNKFESIIGVEYCSVGYWGWFLFGLLGCLLFFLKTSKIVQQNLALKERYNCRSDNYNISSSNIKKVGLLGIWAGVLAALLGIGGGLVLGTTLLAMGVGAQSLTSSANCFVVLTSFISLFQAFLFGGILPNELIFFFLVAGVGSYLISLGITWLVKKFKRPSILLIVLSFMLSLSLVVLPTFTVWKSFNNPSQMFSFHPVC